MFSAISLYCPVQKKKSSCLVNNGEEKEEVVIKTVFSHLFSWQEEARNYLCQQKPPKGGAPTHDRYPEFRNHSSDRLVGEGGGGLGGDAQQMALLKPPHPNPVATLNPFFLIAVGVWL